MKTITNFTINVDLHRLMVTPSLTTSNNVIYTVNDNRDLNLLTITHNTAKPLYHVGNFTLVKAISNDQAFHLQYDIKYNGVYFGYIMTDKTKKYGYNNQLMPLRIDNEALYKQDHGSVLIKFLEVFNLVLSNHSQLDIAIDTQDADVADLILSYTKQSDTYKRIKRKNDQGFHRNGVVDEVTGNQVYTTVFPGSRVSVKMYDKSNELLKSKKDYISEYFTRNSFDDSKPVYRVELSVKAKALKNSSNHAVTEDGEYMSWYKYNKLYNNEDTKGHRKSEMTTTVIELDRLSDKPYLISLFKYFFPIDIRKVNQQKLFRCEKVKLIDFENYILPDITTTTIMKDTENKMIMEKRSIKDNLTMFKRTKHPIYFEAATTLSNSNSLYGYTNELINNMNLNDVIINAGLRYLLEDVVIQNKVRIDPVLSEEAPTAFRSSTTSLFKDAA